MQERYEHPFTAVMRSQAANFYFSHYRAHFSTKVIAHVMACVPQLMIWGAHTALLWSELHYVAHTHNMCWVKRLSQLHWTCRTSLALFVQRSEPLCCAFADDHCLWDGYGSYPTAIQLCPVRL